MDETHFWVQEPSPFDPQLYSHKFEGPGVGYEVGICLRTGWIVCWNGASPCGSYPDINVARDFLVYELGEWEMVSADGACSDNGQYFITPTGRNGYVDKMMADARARHKTVNKLLKDYNIGVLKNMYKGELRFHHQIFEAVINICADADQQQIELENEWE